MLFGCFSGIVRERQREMGSRNHTSLPQDAIFVGGHAVRSSRLAGRASACAQRKGTNCCLYYTSLTYSLLVGLPTVNSQRSLYIARFMVAGRACGLLNNPLFHNIKIILNIPVEPLAVALTTLIKKNLSLLIVCVLAFQEQAEAYSDCTGRKTRN